MTTMGKKKKVNRSHSEEFKREAVGLLESRGERTAAEVAASLGVQSGQLYQWRKELGSQARPAELESLEEENRRLRLQNSQQNKEIDTLKKSVALFARDLRR